MRSMKFHSASQFSLLVVLVLTTAAVGHGKKNKSHDKEYAVVVDCGSSGTRAHIYEWDSSVGQVDYLNDIEPLRDENGEVVTRKFQPGLSDFSDKLFELNAYAGRILKFVASNIPKDSHKHTRVYVFATAGMRLLEEETRKTMMDKLHNRLTESIASKKYDFNLTKLNVITGTAEGRYQWITVNSMFKSFLEKPSTLSDTYGVIEMGGASLQVAYNVKIPGKTLDDNVLPKNLAAFKSLIVEPKINEGNENLNFAVFSVSFLGFGINSARDAYVDMLIKRDKAAVSSWYEAAAALSGESHKTFLKHVPLYIMDPCIPMGAIQRATKPFVMFKGSKTVGYKLDDAGLEPTFEVRAVGTGKYQLCRQNIEELLEIVKRESMNCKTPEQCPYRLLGEKFIPFEDIKIVGLGSIYYSTLGMLEGKTVYNSGLVSRKSRDVCRELYNDPAIIEGEKEREKHDRMRLGCFNAIWVHTVLHKGLGMPRDYKDLRVIDKINEGAINWTLGAAISSSVKLIKNMKYQINLQVSKSFNRGGGKNAKKVQSTKPPIVLPSDLSLLKARLLLNYLKQINPEYTNQISVG